MVSPNRNRIPARAPLGLAAMAVARTLALALAGAALGGLGGRWGYEIFGTYAFGDNLEGFGHVLIGIVVGTLVGGIIGALAPWRRGASAMGLAFVVTSIAAAAFLTGVVYIGAWTNADGPSGLAPFVGILGLPAGPIIVVLLARHLRTRGSEPDR